MVGLYVCGMHLQFNLPVKVMVTIRQTCFSLANTSNSFLYKLSSGMSRVNFRADGINLEVEG